MSVSSVGTEDAVANAGEFLHQPRQARSRRTLERILRAALRLLEEKGSEALTITAITHHAKASVGSFYARFDGKDDLLRYLGEHSLAEALEYWSDGIGALEAGAALGRTADRVVQVLGSLHLSGPGRALALLTGVEDPSPTRRKRFEERVSGDLQLLCEVPTVRAELAARIVVGVLYEAVARPGGRAAGATGEELPETKLLLPELVQLLEGYLGRESPIPPGPSPKAPRDGSVPPAGSAPDPFEIWE